MQLRPQAITHIPLFEEHVLTNERFSALPIQMQNDLSILYSLDESMILCGQIAEYLYEGTSEMPENIEVIVRDAAKLGLMDCDDVQAPVPAPETAQPDTQAQEGETEIEIPADATIVVIQVNPEGEIEEMNVPPAQVSGVYDNDGNFQFESKWAKSGTILSSVCVFECRKSIKTLPMALGNITILVGEPGVMGEYRKTLVKGKTGAKLKYDKTKNYDTAKQTHVLRGNETQDVPTS